MKYIAIELLESLFIVEVCCGEIEYTYETISTDIATVHFNFKFNCNKCKKELGHARITGSGHIYNKLVNVTEWTLGLSRSANDEAVN